VAESVAELVIALILVLCRNIYEACRSLKEGRWERYSFIGTQISGKTIGVVGVGNVGSLVVRKAASLGLRVLGYDKKNIDNIAKEVGMEVASSLEELIKESDVVSLHVPLTNETYHMIGWDELTLFKRSSYLINTSRGRVVDGRALLHALERRVLAGAALDVFEYEPPKEEWEWRLIRHPRVIATPHIGALTQESLDKASMEIARSIVRELSI